MDYNKQLQNLISDAKKAGFNLIDGKFKPMYDQMIPVVEMFLVYNTTYEKTGHYYIYKDTVIIDESDYEQILHTGKKFNTLSAKDDELGETALDTILDILDKYNYSGISLAEGATDGQIDMMYSTYRIYSDNDKCVDVWFSKEYDNCEFPRGYISIYKMTGSDYKKHEKVVLHLKKFMRDN